MFEDQDLNEKIAEIIPEGYGGPINIQDGKAYLLDENGADLPPVAL